VVRDRVIPPEVVLTVVRTFPFGPVVLVMVVSPAVARRVTDVPLLVVRIVMLVRVGPNFLGIVSLPEFGGSPFTRADVVVIRLQSSRKACLLYNLTLPTKA
jgi:hypothetical protein